MNCQNNNYTVSVIQGDDTTIQVTLKDSAGTIVTSSTVSNLYFTCSYEHYSAQFTYTNNVWTLSIPKTTTAAWSATSMSGTTWDLTAIFVGGAVQTEIYKGTLIVYPKINPIYPTKGQIINMNLDGTSRQYRILKLNESVAEVLTMFNISDSIKFAASGQIYDGSILDTYLNTTWYSTLSNAAKAAIVDKTFNQDSWNWGTSGNPDYNGVYNSEGTPTNYQISLGNGVFGSQITRHVYAISVQDVISYLGVTPEMTSANTTLTYNNIWQMFWNDTQSHSNTNLWLNSADASSSDTAWSVIGIFGYVDGYTANNTNAARGVFQIDLSKIAWS